MIKSGHLGSTFIICVLCFSTFLCVTVPAEAYIRTLSYTSTDVPKVVPPESSITSNLLVPTGVCSKLVGIEVPVSAASGHNDQDMTLTLTRLLFTGDQTATLMPGDMYSNNCLSNIYPVFSDSATARVVDICTAEPYGKTLNSPVLPETPLSAFVGTDAGGLWQMTMGDMSANSSGGQTLNSWGLTLRCGNIDAFDPVLDGSPEAITIQSDGKLLIGGNFTTVDGISHNRIARLNADGSPDSSFNASVDNGSVSAVIELPDKRILIAGSFTSVQGFTRNRLALLKHDGSLDFGLAFVNNTIISMVRDHSGRILIGGTFSTVGSTSQSYLARLTSPTGGIDATFTPSLNGTVRSIAVQNDGKVLVGGSFTTNNVTQPAVRIARFNTNGTLDTSFNASADNDVLDIAVQPDGKIIISGLFTQVNGTTMNYIARLNKDGSLDGTDLAASAPVGMTAIQPDGKIIVAGYFTTLASQPRTRLARLNTDWSLDPDFAPTIDKAGWRIAVQPDGKIIAGGSFTLANGESRSRIARFHPDGRIDSQLPPDPNSNVYTMANQPDGKTLIGGSFNLIGTTPAPWIARLNTDNTLDTSFNINPKDLTLSYGHCGNISVQPDGKILVLTTESTAPAQPYHSYLYRFNANGSRDNSFAKAIFDATSTSSSTTTSLILQPDGKILVSGIFTTVNGQSRAGVARLHPDGQLDASFNPVIQYTSGSDNAAWPHLALQTDGKILLYFEVPEYVASVNGQVSPRLVRLNADGTTDTGFQATVTYANRTKIDTVQPRPDGKILFEGTFTAINGTPVVDFALLNPDGSPDTSFFPDTTSVLGYALQADGKLLAYTGAAPYYSLSRLNMFGELDTSLSIPMAYFSKLNPDGKISGGMPRSGLTGFNHRPLRMSNPDAALQSLTVSQLTSTVKWVRAGSSPELTFVKFEHSSDGLTWTPLGTGSRAFDVTSWYLDGVSSWTYYWPDMPKNINHYVRAFGTADQPMLNGEGGSIIESVRLFYLPSAPSVGTSSSAYVVGRNASLHATVNPNNLPSTVTIEYGTTTNYGSSITLSPNPTTGGTSTMFFADLSNLQLNTTYHYRIVATNSVGTTYGNDKTFTITCLGPVRVSGFDFNSISAGETTLVSGSEMQFLTRDFTESFPVVDLPLKLTGGFNCDFSQQTGASSILGPLTIKAGSVTANGIVLR